MVVNCGATGIRLEAIALPGKPVLHDGVSIENSTSGRLEVDLLKLSARICRWSWAAAGFGQRLFVVACVCLPKSVGGERQKFTGRDCEQKMADSLGGGFGCSCLPELAGGDGGCRWRLVLLLLTQIDRWRQHIL